MLERTIESIPTLDILTERKKNKMAIRKSLVRTTAPKQGDKPRSSSGSPYGRESKAQKAPNVNRNGSDQQVRDISPSTLHERLLAMPDQKTGVAEARALARFIMNESITRGATVPHNIYEACEVLARRCPELTSESHRKRALIQVRVALGVRPR